MSQFLSQSLDVDAILVPSRSVEHSEGMARLFWLLDRVACPARFLDEGVDDSIEVLVYRSGCG